MDWKKTEEQLPIDKQPDDIDFRTDHVLAYKDGVCVVGYFFEWEHHDLHFACGRSNFGMPSHWCEIKKPKT